MTLHKRLLRAVLAIACVILSLPPCVRSAGVGFYGSTGYGEGSYTGNDESVNFSTLSYEKFRLGGGFVFDNAVPSNSIFNYRLNLGAEGVADNVGDGAGLTYNFSGIRFNWLNDFGFALIRAPGLRWWLGPQQGLFILDEADASDNGIFSYDGALGVVTGINFYMPRRLTLGLDLALRYVFEIATRAFRSPGDNFDASYIGNGWECGLTVSFMLRGRDRFRR